VLLELERTLHNNVLKETKKGWFDINLETQSSWPQKHKRTCAYRDGSYAIQPVIGLIRTHEPLAHIHALVITAGRIFEIGSTGISSLKGHSLQRSRCLNTFAAMYGHMPLVATTVKAVDSRRSWFW